MEKADTGSVLVLDKIMPERKIFREYRLYGAK